MFHALEIVERCRDLLANVQALSQSLVGLAACIMNWALSSEIRPPLAEAQRARVAELILEYSWPCRFIDPGISNLCAEVTAILEENRRFKNVMDPPPASCLPKRRPPASYSPAR